MPRKTGLAYLLPFEDPELAVDHPSKGLPPIPEDPYAPLGKRERNRLEKIQMEEALKNWTPAHVVQSWEVDAARKKKHDEVLKFKLSWGDYDKDGLPSPILTSREEFERRWCPQDSSSSRRAQSPYNAEFDPDHDDFRQFAVHTLHLGYHRFHPSTDPWPGEKEEEEGIQEDQICWIMEYTERECAIIRRQIAQIIGVFPAVTDKETTAYDDDMAFRYERRMLTRCCRLNKKCIRPSHIRIFTPSGTVIP